MDGAQLAGVSILSISLISRHGMGLPEGTVERQQKKDYNNSKLPKVKLIYSKGFMPLLVVTHWLAHVLVVYLI